MEDLNTIDDEVNTNQSQQMENVDTNSIGVRIPRQRKRVQTINHLPSMTKQGDKAAADINNILKNAKATGLIPTRNVEPIEGELPEVDSFHDAMNTVVEAQSAFDALPSDLKQKFGNDPAKYLEFVGEKNEDGSLKNTDELVKMGLLKKIAPTDAEVIGEVVGEVIKEAVIKEPAEPPVVNNPEPSEG